jgi:nitrous oxide reductase accessory protein NosL
VLILKPLPTWALLLFLLLPALPAGGADLKPRRPAPADKCPVCGMFVAKYPDFAGRIIFRDGAAAFFDGSKDLFKYYLNIVCDSELMTSRIELRDGQVTTAGDTP